MMETPEKEKLLETVRALRKEATEKLTGSRHDQAVQRLDDILEVVEKQDMSPAEISAVSNVLVGKVEDTPSAEPVEALVEVVSEAPAQGSDDIVFEEGEGGSASVPEVAAGETVLSEGNEVIVDQGAPEIDVAALPEVVVEPVVVSDELVQEVAEEPVIEEEPSGTDMGTVAAVGAGAIVAGAIAKNLVAEAAEAVPEVELIDLVELHEGAVEAPAIEIAEVTVPEVAAPEIVSGLEVEAAAPPVELVEITDVLEVEASGVAVPGLELAPEVGAIEIESLDPVEVLEMEQASKVDLAALEVDIPAEDNLQEVEIAVPAVPEIEMVEVVAVPEITEAPAHIPVVEVEASPPITDIVPDIDPAKVAIAAAAAAVTVAAVSDKVADVSAAPAPALGGAAPTVLTGSNLKRHPSYGGGRGNWVVRFINTLRGKDYI